MCSGSISLTTTGKIDDEMADSTLKRSYTLQCTDHFLYDILGTTKVPSIKVI